MKALALALALASLLAVGCAEVTCRQIAGSTPAKLEPQKWNGAWSGRDGESFHARVKDPARGLIEVAWLEIKDDAIVDHRLDVHIREVGGWLWASYKEEKDKAYTVARVGEPGERLLAWTLRPGPIIKRVKAGELKGEILKDEKGKETKEVRLEALSDADLQAVRDGKWGDVFDWDKPALNVEHHRD